MKRLFLLLLIYISLAPIQAQSLSPDDTEGALSLLSEQRKALKKADGPRSASLISDMLKLGMWEELEKEFRKRNLPAELSLQKAHLLMLKNRYEEAEQILRKIKAGPDSQESFHLLKIRLLTEAWELKKAEESCINILKNLLAMVC